MESHKTIISFALLLAILPLAQSMCPKGSFIDKSDGNECKLCPSGTFNHRVDATRCTKCAAGGESRPGSTSRFDCRDCAPGMDASDDCLTCDPGYYNPFVNGRRCFKCPKGTFTNTYSPNYCRPCRPGRVTNKRRTSVCKLCGGRQYQPQLGQKFCITCPSGSLANPDGASCKPTCTDPGNPKCKTCPEGQELTADGECVDCADGYISPYESNTKCQPCPDALTRSFLVPSVLVPNEARSRCVCRSGEYLYEDEPFGPSELNPICRICPDGKGSDGIKCFD